MLILYEDKLETKTLLAQHFFINHVIHSYSNTISAKLYYYVRTLHAIIFMIMWLVMIMSEAILYLDIIFYSSDTETSI